MVSYLRSDEKNMSNMLYIYFRLYNNIVVLSLVDLETAPMRGVVETNFRLLKKVLMI